MWDDDSVIFVSYICTYRKFSFFDVLEYKFDTINQIITFNMMKAKLTNCCGMTLVEIIKQLKEHQSN